jgi:hypothetical protein
VNDFATGAATFVVAPAFVAPDFGVFDDVGMGIPALLLDLWLFPL